MVINGIDQWLSAIFWDAKRAKDHWHDFHIRAILHLNLACLRRNVKSWLTFSGCKYLSLSTSFCLPGCSLRDKYRWKSLSFSSSYLSKTEDYSECRLAVESTYLLNTYNQRTSTLNLPWKLNYLTLHHRVFSNLAPFCLIRINTTTLFSCSHPLNFIALWSDLRCELPLNVLCNIVFTFH